MNLHESNTSLYGLAQGLMHGQHSRVDEINQRTVERQFADKPMKPCLDLRSLPTKYAIFPLIDRRTLQRGADQHIYVHSTTSDLYVFAAVGRQEEQPHLTIATQYKFEGRIHPNLASGKIGQDRFNNNTRTQLRNTV